MNYKELREIAKPHIRKGSNFPSNAFLLCNQLHIPHKNEKRCRSDFEGKLNPLYDTPAFLYIDNEGNKTVYYKSTSTYWNFYIFHEIAHYLLGHEDNSPENEQEANLLACILAAPEENFPTTIKTAMDLSTTANIPIDKAEEYWQIIRPRRFFHAKHREKIIIGLSILAVFLILTLFSQLFILKVIITNAI